MTQHHLQGRTENEVTWFQRRSFLQAAAAWSAVGSLGAAHAQARGNIVELQGDATVNGQPLLPQQSIITGDQISTGPGSTVIFVLGNSAFHVRQNSTLSVERGPSLNAVSLLRLLTGAVVSVWGKGSPRQIMTPTLTAGIRGTGVYTEVPANQNGRSYFCNCYGVVDVSSGPDRELSESTHHQAFWGEGGTAAGSLTPALMINHTDQELEFLARLIGERTAWQIAGKRSNMAGVSDY
jgi:hypothetical protein